MKSKKKIKKEVFVPRVLKMKLTMTELSPNQIHGFCMSWLSGTIGKHKFEVVSGTGIGSSMIGITYRGKQFSGSITEVVKQFPQIKPVVKK